MAENKAVVRFGVAGGNAFEEVVQQAKTAGEQVAKNFEEGVAKIEGVKVPNIASKLKESAEGAGKEVADAFKRGIDTLTGETITVPFGQVNKQAFQAGESAAKQLAEGLKALSKTPVPKIDVSKISSQIANLKAQLATVPKAMSDVAAAAKKINKVDKPTAQAAEAATKLAKATKDATTAIQNEGKSAKTAGDKAARAQKTASEATRKRFKQLRRGIKTLNDLAAKAQTADGNVVGLSVAFAEVSKASTEIKNIASKMGSVGESAGVVKGITESLNTTLKRLASTTGLGTAEVEQLKRAFATLGLQFKVDQEAINALTEAEQRAARVDVTASVEQFSVLAKQLRRSAESGNLTAASIKRLTSAAVEAATGIQSLSTSGAETQALQAQFTAAASSLAEVAAASESSSVKLIALATSFEELSALMPGLSAQGLEFALAVKQIATSSTGSKVLSDELGKIKQALDAANTKAREFATTEEKATAAASELGQTTKVLSTRLNTLQAAAKQNNIALTAEDFQRLNEVVKQTDVTLERAKSGLVGVVTTATQADKAMLKFNEAVAASGGSAKANRAALKELEAEFVRINAAASAIGLEKVTLDAEQLASQFKSAGISSKNAKASFDRLGLSTKVLSKHYKDLGAEVQLTKAKFRGGISGLQGMFLAQARFIASGFLLFGLLRNIGGGVKRVVVQEEALARVQSVLNDSTKTLADNQDQLKEAMDRVATTLGASIKESAEALFQLGSAGLSTSESIAALQAVMSLSVGTNAESGDTARSVAGIYKNLSDEAKNAGSQVEVMTRIADLMARSFKDNLVDTKALVEGLKFVAGVTSNFGISLEQTLGVLNTFNNNLLRGGLAGRAFRAIITRMATSTKELKSAFGVTFDPNNFDTFLDAFDAINDKLSGIEAGDARIELKKIFGVRQASNVLILAKHIDSVRDNIKGLELNADGAAKAMADIKVTKLSQQLLILSERFKLLVQQVTTLATAAVGGLVRGISFVIDGVTQLNKAMSGLSGKAIELVGALILIRTVMKSLLIFAEQQQMISFGKQLLKVNAALGIMAASGKQATAAIKSLEGATVAAETSAAALSGLTIAFAAVVAVVVAAGIAFKVWKDRQKAAIEAAKADAVEIKKGIAVRELQIRTIRRIINLREELANATVTGDEKASAQISKRISRITKLADIEKTAANESAEVLRRRIEELKRANEEAKKQAFVQNFKEQIDGLKKVKLATELLNKATDTLRNQEERIADLQAKLRATDKDDLSLRDRIIHAIKSRTSALEELRTKQDVQFMVLQKTAPALAEFRQQIEDMGGPTAILNNLTKEQSDKFRQLFDTLSTQSGAFDEWAAKQRAAANVTAETKERLEQLASSADVVKNSMATLIQVTKSVGEVSIENQARKNQIELEGMKENGKTAQEIFDKRIELDQKLLGEKIKSINTERSLANKQADTLLAIEEAKNKQELDLVEDRNSEVKKLGVDLITAKKKTEETKLLNTIKFSKQELDLRKSSLAKLVQFREQATAKEIALTKKLSQLTKAAESEVVRAVQDGQNLVADAIRQGESAADQFDSTISAIKQALVSAQGAELIDADAAQRGIERAKSLFGELATQAIKENGKIIQSDEDVRDARINIAKRIARAEEEIARSRLAQVGAADEAAGIKLSLQEQIQNAKDAQVTLKDAIDKQDSAINTLVGTLEASKTKFVELFAKARIQDARDLATEVSTIASGMAEIAKLDLAQPMDAFDKTVKNSTSSLDVLIARMQELIDLQSSVQPSGRFQDQFLPPSHTGSLIPGRGEQIYKLLGHEYVMPPFATEYYGEHILNMMRSKTLPKSLFEQPNTPVSQGSVVIQITPDVLKSTKNMSEDEIRGLTRRIARSLEVEMSRTYAGKAVN